ncbi:hypothetical protein [Archangium lipolyticum]|jgi:hypothetical protein|uniref:hypothetical protein n=1 Tax=Archangium lipolyticum TaxID=2970465 RepID=UPI00214A0946|nr:hypothetical protein [Archangium lipolyticum]
MPQFARSLDIYQGFNFKKDVQTPVGFVTKLELGDVVLAADQTSIKDPEQPGQNLAGVVGVINHYLWETGTTDAMYLSMQISVKNKTDLTAKLLTSWTDMNVTFAYVLYEYDPVEKKYFKSNWTEPELKGILEKNGNDLNLSVADDPSTEVQSPKVYALQLGVKPQTEEQTVHMATGVNKNVSKIWGINAAA